jgi:hypothetical protein
LDEIVEFFLIEPLSRFLVLLLLEGGDVVDSLSSSPSPPDNLLTATSAAFLFGFTIGIEEVQSRVGKKAKKDFFVALGSLSVGLGSPEDHSGRQKKLGWDHCPNQTNVGSDNIKIAFRLLCKRSQHSSIRAFTVVQVGLILVKRYHKTTLVFSLV